MESKILPSVSVPPELLEAIRSFPLQREVEHCGSRITISPFDFYAKCSVCGSQIKVRSFSAHDDIEDVFDAVFEWMTQPGAQALVQRRQDVILADKDE